MTYSNLMRAADILVQESQQGIGPYSEIEVAVPSELEGIVTQLGYTFDPNNLAKADSLLSELSDDTLRKVIVGKINLDTLYTKADADMVDFILDEMVFASRHVCNFNWLI